MCVLDAPAQSFQVGVKRVQLPWVNIKYSRPFFKQALQFFSEIGVRKDAEICSSYTKIKFCYFKIADWKFL